MKKLYISDLDGTLLGSDGRISEFSRKLLNELLEKELLFTVATGRSLISIGDILNGVNIKLPVINNNGAKISSLNNFEHLYRNFLDRKLGQDILDILLDHWCSPFINAEEDGTDILLYEKNTNNGTNMFIDIRKGKNDPRLREIEVFDRIDNIDVINFNIIDSKKKITEVKDILNNLYGDEIDMHITYEPNWENWGWLTISEIKSNKAFGIKTLVSKFINEEVEVTVFGDQLNDRLMLEFADRSIVVSNADSELKAIADLVIGNNTEDSVIKFIADEMGVEYSKDEFRA